jgi:hypothetical protein
MAYFEQLPFIGRTLGLAQLKLAFEEGYRTPQDFVVELECVRADGQVEAVAVPVRAGLEGPGLGRPFGDVVPVARADKLGAERGTWPYRGTGLYVGIREIRLLQPATAPGCRFTVIADVPFLASAAGVPVVAQASTPVALQLDRDWGQPHLWEDGVGQVILVFARDGDIWLTRRPGLGGPWAQPWRITSDGQSGLPWAGKDKSGRLTLLRQRGAVTALAWSRDDGSTLGGR